MDSLEKILGTVKFNSLSELEKSRINELISANQVYEYLVAGIIGGHGWRRVLGEAYLEYVKPVRDAKAKKAALVAAKAATADQPERSVIFGVGDVESFTKTRVML